MKKNKKNHLHIFFRNTLKVILISVLSISCWEISKKQVSYKKNIIIYKELEQKKEKAKDINQFLYDNGFDWITVTNTAINYPLMTYDNNEYYIYHNYKGEEDIGGAIFYDCYDDPNNGTLSIIYGHSMKNGTMFNNLHYFQQDHNRFKNSKLIINTKDGSTTYNPLGYYVTNNDFFYRDLDNESTINVISAIEKKSKYFIKDTKVTEGAHIVALYTCDYSEVKNGKLIVFYIEDAN